MKLNKILVSKRTKEDEELDDIALFDDIKTKKNNNNSVVPPLFTISTLGLDYNNYKYMSGFTQKVHNIF
jgi:hypothetical protein